jgi:phage-related protein
MTDSLVIANFVELMKQGVASSDPRCPGAIFQLMPGYTFGNPVPDQSIIASMSGDGEIPLGERASNRTHVVPVGISAPNRAILVQAREVLVALVDQPQWLLTWRRDSAPDTVFECFRATTSVINYDTRYERQNVGSLTLTFTAKPYARSSTYEVLAFANSPSDGPGDAPSPITVDNYATVTGTHWSRETF